MKKNIVFILFFLIFTLAFNYGLVNGLLLNNDPSKIVVDDSVITEFVTETSYQKLKEFKNPFTPTDRFLYPFKINYSLSDTSTSYSLPFLLFRPFLDTHRSLILIVLINILLSPFVMYILLRSFKINYYISFISSLIYGFTPFISQRIQGHYTYTPIYLFPLTLLIIFKFLKAKEFKKKLILSIIFGLVMAFTLLSNFQYFISVLLSIIFFVALFSIKDRKKLFDFIKTNLIHIAGSITSFFIILIPWSIQVKNFITSYGVEPIPGFGGAVVLSADVMNLLIPSEYNPFYNSIFRTINDNTVMLGDIKKIFFNSWNSFAYPGLIIIGLFIYLILIRKKLPKRLWTIIKPYFIATAFFVVLTLGPFLKIFDNWFITLEEGIRVYFPLPFLSFHYIPVLNSMRAPSRFTPIYVFFAVITISYLLNYLFHRIKNSQGRTFFIGILFLLFLFDQFYQIRPFNMQRIPLKEYEFIKSHSKSSTVLEIPFTVRDGFQYIGFVHAVSPMNGALIHGKPIIGGYIARVPQKVFDYYKKLPFIGYVASIIDKGNYDPLKEKPEEPNVFPYNRPLELVDDELKSLNINYILLKNDEKYTDAISDVITQVNFKKVMTDNNYDLYLR